MSNSDSPKQLPDDFGLTLPNLRPPKQNSAPPREPSDNFDLTTPNLQMPPRSNQNSVDDFGATTPNLRLSSQAKQPPPNDYSSRDADDFGLTGNNARQTPSEIDFGSTLTDFSAVQPKRNEANADFGATMPFIKLPPNERQKITRYQEEVRAQTAAAEAEQAATAQKKKSGIPLWAWIVGGGFAGFAFLAIIGLAAYLFLFRETGYTIVVKGAPPQSEVYLDGIRRGVTSADGSTNIPGVEAEKKRALKVTHEGYTDYNDAITGANGEKKQVVAVMKPLEAAPPTQPQTSVDPNEDSRVTAAEKNAFDALDKLVDPFTIDQLVAAMNLEIINFESGKYDIPPARIRFLQKAAEKFKHVAATGKVEVGGHTDTDGNPQNNLTLSNNRAIAVRSTLISFGVNPAMLTPNGYGSSKPAADNKTEEGKFKNRRIEYKVLAR